MLENLEPREVFSEFESITRVPRPSKHEGKINEYLRQWAENHGLESQVDAIGNVVIRKPASQGMESAAPVILQAHMDMVCEKDGGVEHDFMHDPINTYVEDGWVHARGTTLGADDGIGMSMALAVLASKDVAHPALECLFTVDEETGLTGAFNLGKGMLTAKRLINLDSEDDGQVFIGCAGGIDTLATTPCIMEPAPSGWFCARVSISGLVGGHSGDDINKGRANANQLLARYLFAIMQGGEMRIADIDGGNLRNAIAREACATVCVPMGRKEELRVVLNRIAADWELEYKGIEDGLRADLESAVLPAKAMTAELTQRLVRTLYACPHGVVAMSRDIPGLVETSTNLASVKIKDGNIIINTSQRSSTESAKHDIKNKVECSLVLGGFSVTHGDGYPGWKPDTSSPILEAAVRAYKDLFGEEPEVKAIHAGLECGLFLEKYPGLDMISFGPQMTGVHSPSEKLSIESTQRTYKWLLRVLEKC